uniref:Uncharacterized protein n=1 Tax=Medicago truncatula TaxID=3880 RepID=I3SM91_MEDTR|nr:unknown [Medicago truncatula]
MFTLHFLPFGLVNSLRDFPLLHCTRIRPVI